MTELSGNYYDDLKVLEKNLRQEKNFDILKREVVIGGKNATFYFIDGFVGEDMINKLMTFFYGLKKEDLSDIDTFIKQGMPYTEIEKIGQIAKAEKFFYSGQSLLLIEGFKECILIDCRTYPARAVSEPWKDKVMRGSRDGFVETLVSNAALLRRRIRDNMYSMEMFQVGEKSKTDVAVCYMENLVDKKLLERIKATISGIKVDALTMNVQSLAECMFKGRWINPFPKYKYSERPDTAAAAILDGGIVIMVDTSPAVMILPTNIFDVIEEADDYNFSPLVGSYIRLTRFFFTLLTVFLTPIWLLLQSNPQWVPEWLEFITIQEDITVPVLLQLLILELAVDGLKLAAINTPNLLSTPLSILAGIVVGEYAVQSGWFNSEALLYMAVVTVGTYSQASFEMGYALKFVRIATLFFVWGLGRLGLLMGAVLFISMIVFNKTISGKSYIYPIYPFDKEMLKRKLLRKRLPHTNINK